MNIQRRFLVPTLMLLFCLSILGVSGFLSLKMTHAASPKAATPPASTTSTFERTVGLTALQNQGCTAAKGPAGLIVLDFGEPQYLNDAYGTTLFSGSFASEGGITKAVDKFIFGAWSCKSSSTSLQIAVGTNNNNLHGLGTSLPLWKNTGIRWARMINNIQSYVIASGYSSVFTIYGADDIEVNQAQQWATYGETSNYVNGYASATTVPLLDYGTDTGGANPTPWTPQQFWSVVAGRPNSIILPQIYVSSEASDWESFDQWACTNEGGPLKIIGTAADNPTNPLTPDQAWTDMYTALGTNSCTAATQSQLIYSTNF